MSKQLTKTKSLAKSKTEANEAIQPKKKERNSAIELLRIVSIMMIIIHHTIVHGGLYGNQTNLLSRVLSHFYYMGNIGINLFVLITGYVLLEMSPSLKRLFKGIITPVWFYSWLFLILALLTGVNMTQSDILIAAFPILSGAYWFATVYAWTYLLFPALSEGLKKCNNYIILAFALASAYFLCIGNKIPNFLKDVTTGGTGLLFFLFLIFIGVYLAKTKIHQTKIGRIISFAALIGCFIYLGYADAHNINIVNAPQYGFQVLFTTSIFASFAGFNFKSKWINILASYSFAVYLIHDNVFVRNNWIWSKFAITKLFPHFCGNSAWYINEIFYAAAIYLVCSGIEQLRRMLFNYVGGLIKKRRATA